MTSRGEWTAELLLDGVFVGGVRPVVAWEWWHEPSGERGCVETREAAMTVLDATAREHLEQRDR